MKFERSVDKGNKWLRTSEDWLIRTVKAMKPSHINKSNEEIVYEVANSDSYTLGMFTVRITLDEGEIIPKPVIEEVIDEEIIETVKKKAKKKTSKKKTTKRKTRKKKDDNED